MENHEANIQAMLTHLKRDTHIPFEILLADAQGELSSDGHDRITEHIDLCSECKNDLEQITCYMHLSYDSLADDSVGKDRTILINATIRMRLELVAKVNSVRDTIAQDIAQLFIPEDMWFSIEPTIEVYRAWLSSIDQVEVDSSDKLQIAAFSGGTVENKEEFMKVADSIRFSDYVCDLVNEKCDSQNDIDQILTGIVADGSALLSKLGLQEGMLEVVQFTVGKIFRGMK